MGFFLTLSFFNAKIEKKNIYIFSLFGSKDLPQNL